MAIIDAEKRALGPLLTLKVLRFWLHNIQDDGYTILVVVPYDTLIRVGTISRD